MDTTGLTLTDRANVGANISISGSESSRHKSRVFSRAGAIQSVFVFLMNREYEGNSPAGRRFIHQYKIKHYQQALCDRNHQELAGHEDSVNQLLQVNGNTLVSVSDDPTVRVWSDKAGRWQFVQALTLHSDRVHGLASLSDFRFVTCSHDRSVIIWHKLNDDWREWTRIQTGRVCTDIIALTPDNFIVTTSHGHVGSFHIDGLECYPYWFNEYRDAIYNVTRLDAESFTLCTMDGIFAYWQRRGSEWNRYNNHCPASIRNGGQNYPLTAVPLCEGIIAVGYSLGHIVVWWCHKYNESSGRLTWREMQTLEHGDEPEEVKGILPISEVSFISYGDDACMALWRLDHNKKWQLQQRIIDIHTYAIANCLEVFRDHYWSIDNSGAVHCWRWTGEELVHECQRVSSRQDYDDAFLRSSGIRLLGLGYSDEVATFSEDCTIKIWPLFRAGIAE
ncbi:WD-40 repeat-containing protein [Elysia marginata]|uniref:WD-40 repeat-containing protein n=1 Tax=Elysia marginata TaxID=1093978 RepID=A0AAV4JNY4_9GAST|nr:WD-40 repeat-containing protein [Elysia marginata]